jgi:vacuolar-type H+-ATPase subunit H
MKEKERAIAEMIEKENQAKKNIEKFMEEQEKIRLQFEKEIHDKSKLYIIK